MDAAALIEGASSAMTSLSQKWSGDVMFRRRVAVAGGALAVAGLLAWGLSKPSKKSSKSKKGEKEGDISQGVSNSEPLSLSKYEKVMLDSLISPDRLGDNVGFSSIGGLDDQIASIEELVILPLSRPDLFAHSKVAATPSGVLLYGPPGTGKTLLAKAIAKEAKASFISLNIATIENKWYGETPKLIDALFSLARKMAPTVIFCDEVDGFLGTRQDHESQHSSTMKTKFMENWDGLLSSAAGDNKQQWVLVVAATNKPWTIDPAVLRRMPRQIEVSLPDAKARASILQVLLSGERVSEDIDIAAVALATEGYSGSDLKEVVRAASMIPIREALRAERAATRATGPAGGAGAGSASAGPRPISNDDFTAALEAVRPNGAQAKEYQLRALMSGTNWGTKASHAAASAIARAGAGAGGHGPSPLARAAVSAAASAASGGVPYATTPKGSSPPSDTHAAGSEAARAMLMFGPSAKANSLNLAAAIEREAAAKRAASGAAAAAGAPAVAGV